MALEDRSDADCRATIGLPLKEGFRQLYPALTEAELDTCVATYRRMKGVVIGSVIAMVGVSMVIMGSGGESAEAGKFGLLGDGLSLLAAVCWSVYALLLRKLQAFYSALFVTRKTFFYGLITALPFLLLEPTQLSWQTFTLPAVWVNLLTLAVLSSSLAFVIWAWVIGRIGAVKAGNYLYFQPIVTLIFGAIVLHEAMSLLGITGCLVTILGVYALDLYRRLNGQTLPAV